MRVPIPDCRFTGIEPRLCNICIVMGILLDSLRRTSRYFGRVRGALPGGCSRTRGASSLFSLILLEFVHTSRTAQTAIDSPVLLVDASSFLHASATDPIPSDMIVYVSFCITLNSLAALQIFLPQDFPSPLGLFFGFVPLYAIRASSGYISTLPWSRRTHQRVHLNFWVAAQQQGSPESRTSSSFQQCFFLLLYLSAFSDVAHDVPAVEFGECDAHVWCCCSGFALG